MTMPGLPKVPAATKIDPPLPPICAPQGFGGPLSTPVSQRARMLRVMKTAKALAEASHEPPVQRFATMLISQLVELMPELQEVSAWHTVGQRRTQDEMGRIVERTIPDSFFGDGSF